jgi:hypothetical protein
VLCAAGSRASQQNSIVQQASMQPPTMLQNSSNLIQVLRKGRGTDFVYKV